MPVGNIIEAHHYSAIPVGLWRWPNFSPAELASHGDGSIRIDVRAIDALQRARNLVGRPMIITSAYRDPVWNAIVGGAPMSRHKFGDAFDISTVGHDRAALLGALRLAGLGGFGFYQTFIHADIWNARHWFGGSVSERIWREIDGLA